MGRWLWWTLGAALVAAVVVAALHVSEAGAFVRIARRSEPSWFLVIVALDAATVWVLVRALGTEASPAGIFASFMISSLLRTVGVLPGGLGTFEATSVVTLRMVGVDVPVGLAATLRFRGLSFWLPMPIGLWCSRRVADVCS